MSMNFEFEHDAASVFDLLTDPQFLVDRCLAMGELEASCEVEEKAGVTVVSLTRKLKRDLPRFLAKMLDPEQIMQMTEKWQADGNGGWNGEYTFDMEGQPVCIRAKFELYPTDAGCCYSIEHQVKAKIPLIGGRIEKYIHDQAEEGCADELDYLQGQLG
jgi:hypothetical protein